MQCYYDFDKINYINMCYSYGYIVFVLITVSACVLYVHMCALCMGAKTKFSLGNRDWHYAPRSVVPGCALQY